MSSVPVRIGDEVVEHARELGLEGDPRTELARMAKFGANLTHTEGNRRYDGWWLRVEQGEVKAVGKLGDKEIVELHQMIYRLGRRDRVQKAIALHKDRKDRE